MTRAPTPNPLAGRSLRAPVLWGVVWGVLQAAAPLGFWWLTPATVYALSVALIAAVYIGFAVADGRPRVIAVETTVAGSSHQKPSGDAAWMTPKTTPHKMGARSDRPASGLGVGARVIGGPVGWRLPAAAPRRERR